MKITINRGMDLLVGFGQLCLSSNHIAGFSDHQYLCKESIDTLDFLHEDNLQRKEGSETTTLVGCYLLWFSSNLIGGFFDHQYLCKESINILYFMLGVNLQGRKDLTLPLLVECGQLCLLSDHLAGFFWLSISLEGVSWYLRCLEVAIRVR